MSVTTNRTGQVLWYLMLLGGFGIGAIAAVLVFFKGHDHMYNVTRQVPWGILISTYVFFVVSSTGLCLVSSLGHVFGFKQFELIGKRAIILAIITLLAGFGTIGMEITHPLRMALYVIISPNFQSPIWWMGTLYGLYLVLLCGEFYFLMRGDHKKAFIFGLIGFIAAVTAHSNLGAVFRPSLFSRRAHILGIHALGLRARQRSGNECGISIAKRWNGYLGGEMPGLPHARRSGQSV